MYSPRWALVMKQFNYLISLALFLFAAANSLAHTTDQDELQAFVQEYEAVWQSHDAARLANFFTEDSDMIMGILPRISGRAAIEQWWGQYFSRINPGRQLSISIESWRVVGPGVALLNVDTTTAGTHTETNEIMESRRARGTWIVTRIGSDWKIAALRAHSPIGEMRTAPGTDN